MAIDETSRVYDELLVTLARDGDRQAAERLARRWTPRLLRTARRMLGDAELARDAVQEAWIGIVRGWRRLADPASFPAWAFGILHNKCRDQIRRNQRLRAREADPENAPEPAISARGEDAAAIAQALSRLSFEHRTTSVLFFGEGLSLAEIARATGVPEGTVKSRLFHARSKLRADLKGDDNE